MIAGFSRQRTSRQGTVSFLAAYLSAKIDSLEDGADVVCVFVNDEVNTEVRASLGSIGVRFVALRAAGFDNADFEAARCEGNTVAGCRPIRPMRGGAGKRCRQATTLTAGAELCCWAMAVLVARGSWGRRAQCDLNCHILKRASLAYEGLQGVPHSSCAGQRTALGSRAMVASQQSWLQTARITVKLQIIVTPGPL